MRFLYSIICIGFLISCSRGVASRERAGDTRIEAGAVSSHAAADERDFPLPDIPAALTDPRARAGWLLEHFYDRVDFTDRGLSLDTAFMEQSFANFVSLFPHADTAVPPHAVERAMERASSDREACMFLLAIAEKYLYDPNSPLRDEGAYLWFVDAASRGGVLSEAEMARPLFLRRSVMANRPGMRAKDFTFTETDGSEETLSAFCRKTDYTLLLFHDPDCANCKTTVSILSASPALEKMTASGRMRVLAVYPDGDEALWRKNSGHLPPAWTSGIDDGAIEEEGRFILPVLPTLYLLDRDGTVVLKDPSPSELLTLLPSLP